MENINAQGEIELIIDGKTFYFKYGIMAYSILVESGKLPALIQSGEFSNLIVWSFYAGIKSRTIKNQLSPTFNIETCEDLIESFEDENWGLILTSAMLDQMVFFLKKNRNPEEMIQGYTDFSNHLKSLIPTQALPQSEPLPTVQG